MGIASYSIEYRNSGAAGSGTRSLGTTGSNHYWSRITLKTDAAGCAKFRVSMQTTCYNGATKLGSNEYAAGAQVIVSTTAGNSSYTGSAANLFASHPANNTTWYFEGDVNTRMAPNTTYYLFVLPCWSAADTFTQSTQSFTVTSLAGLGASTIASASSAAETLGTISLTMNRFDSAYYHKATFKIGSATLATSAAFATTLSYTVPRSWFSGYPTATSLTVTVSVQTYTTSACSTTLGSPVTTSVTVTADAGMAPILQNGYASASPYNTGTAAASITGYVSGVSRAEVTLDSAKLDLSATAGASVSSIRVTGGGETDTASPYYTGVLTGTAPITVTVTDSRGRSASQTLTVQCMDYGLPTISAVSVIRCTSNGTESADGKYYRAKATAGCSSLNGQNSVTLKAQVAQGGGSYGSAVTLTSGTAKTVNAGLNPDLRATVKLTATDALGNTTETTVTLPGRKWALKFRADGQGAAFGKAPESSKALELPADWTLRIGAESFLQKVYPVGSIYMSVNSTSPASLFGGTWQRIQDSFLLAAGTTYAAGATGGEAAHTLTEAELATHRHAAIFQTSGSGDFFTIAGASQTSDAGIYAYGGYAGGGQAHNNMPPYLAVYMWKRTA